MSLVALYALAAGLAYLWAGRDSDVGAIKRVGGLTYAISRYVLKRRS